MFADTMSAGGPQFQFRGHNRHRNRRVLLNVHVCMCNRIHTTCTVSRALSDFDGDYAPELRTPRGHRVGERLPEIQLP